MARLVYLLSALMSVTCALLLARRYRKQESRILLWTCVGFSGLATSNILLFVDLTLLPQVDLMLWRNLAALLGVFAFLFGIGFEG